MSFNRLDFANEQILNEKRRLNDNKVALESEISDLRAQ